MEQSIFIGSNKEIFLLWLQNEVHKWNHWFNQELGVNELNATLFKNISLDYKKALDTIYQYDIMKSSYKYTDIPAEFHVQSAYSSFVLSLLSKLSTMER